MKSELHTLTKTRSDFYHYLTSTKDISRASKNATIDKIASIDKRIKEIISDAKAVDSAREMLVSLENLVKFYELTHDLPPHPLSAFGIAKAAIKNARKNGLK